MLTLDLPCLTAFCSFVPLSAQICLVSVTACFSELENVVCRSRSRDPFPMTFYWFSFGVLSGFVLYEVTGVDVFE